MLCPKCGFISFDNLSACGKCKNDLSVLSQELHGTAAAVTGTFFLRSVLNESSASQETDAENDVTAVGIAAPLDNEFSDADTVILASDLGADSGEKEPGAVLDVDESPALEFDLDEIPHLDTSEIASVSPMAPAPAAETPDLEAALALVDLDSQEELDDQGVEGLPGDAPTAGDDILEIDESSLTLHAVEAPPPPVTRSAPEEEPGQLTIDLKQIDLSDLVHEQDIEPPSRNKTPGLTDAKALDLEDTMDLSLFSGDDHEAPVELGQLTAKSKDLEPIDLSLMDEALSELTVEPKQKGQGHQEKGPVDILELSMEDN